LPFDEAIQPCVADVGGFGARRTPEGDKPMMPMDDVRKRLDWLVREHGADYCSLSKMLGRNAAYIQQFIKRGVPRRLAEEDRRKLAAYFGVPEEELGAPTGRIGRAMSPRELMTDPLTTSDYVLIPYYDVAAAAGDGALPEREDPHASLAFQSRWVRSIATGGINSLSAIRVQGDSMYPSLSDGDQILIDTADKEKVRDGIYVLRIDDALVVKRVSVNPVNRCLTIASDNTTYPTWRDVDPSNVQVIGRVVWVGRKV
jgi:phage repressor protein C with HTH and peptisase S24 domain